jgi:hypothetical protein
MRAAPAISVIVPCYRQAGFLREAVLSVHAQTWKDWEIVIVASDRESFDAAEALPKVPDGQACFVAFEGPRGLPAARNSGIGLSAGRWTLPLDADDALEPAFIEKAINAMRGLGDAGGVVAAHARDFGDRTGVRTFGEWWQMKEGNALGVSCGLFPRALWEAVGGYEVGLLGSEDWEFWLKCWHKGAPRAIVPEPLYRYRVHAAQAMAWDNAHEAGRVWQAMIRLIHPEIYADRRVMPWEKTDRQIVAEMPAAIRARLEARRALFPESKALELWCEIAGLGKDTTR